MLDELIANYLGKIESRLLAQIKRGEPGGCWTWLGHKTTNGYGRISAGGKLRLAHRLAYELWVRPIGDDMTIDHLCMTRACVNPEHLEEVTFAENIRRRNALKQECRHGHELTGANTYVNPSSGKRSCRTCRAQGMRQHKVNARAQRQEEGTYVPHARDRDACPQGHPYDGVNASGARTCKTCARAAEARYRERRRTQKAAPGDS